MLTDRLKIDGVRYPSYLRFDMVDLTKIIVGVSDLILYLIPAQFSFSSMLNSEFLLLTVEIFKFLTSAYDIDT